MRLLTRAALAASLLAVSVPVAHAQRIGSLNLLGVASYPSRGTTVDGTTLGGLSGIAYDAARSQYYLISDDPGNLTPDAGDPRFYTATLDLSGPTFGNANVTFTDSTTLLDSTATGFAGGSVDLESIAYDAVSDTIFVSDEGNANALISPSVRQFNRTTGVQTAQFAAPSKFAATGAAGTTGIRQNLAFESATLTNGGTTLLTGTEGALKQDGPAASFGVSTNARLLSFNAATGAAGAEYLYVADPVTEAGTGFTVAGLVELHSLGGDDYLALERSFTLGGALGGGTGYGIRLYQFSLAGATDISSVESLVGATGIQAVQKTLLLDFATLGVTLDNIEGVTVGPTLANGDRALIIVADDNFAANGGQTTQIFAFSASAAAPEPGTIALLGTGLLPLAGAIARRRK